MSADSSSCESRGSSAKWRDRRVGAPEWSKRSSVSAFAPRVRSRISGRMRTMLAPAFRWGPSGEHFPERSPTDPGWTLFVIVVLVRERPHGRRLWTQTGQCPWTLWSSVSLEHLLHPDSLGAPYLDFFLLH